ncbi:MAG: hypothetical protein OEX00_05020, partial [Gammaproteobacteria bacterium]|nr:hypothetical protein [Gammaproteobacteria bacterium]
GLFKNKNIAQEKFEQVRGLGYEPKMMERFKDRRKTYLSIQVEQNRFVNKERWTQILSKYTSGKIESAECEDAPASSRFANIQQAAE